MKRLNAVKKKYNVMTTEDKFNTDINWEVEPLNLYYVYGVYNYYKVLACRI